MKPPVFNYHVPGSVSECLHALAEYGEDCVVLAGGQSLIPLLRVRMAQPKHVVSLRNLRKELSYARETARGIAIGACMTYASAQRSEIVKARCPCLFDVIGLIATPAVRSRGTLCGNVCNADPASELPALALLLNARFKLVSVAGERTVDAENYFIAPYTTARRSDELLLEVDIPATQPNEKIVVKEISRLRGGFPMAGIGIVLINGASAIERSARVVCFGAHPIQMRATNAERELTEHGFGAKGIAAASNALAREIEPHSDVFASEEYRRSVAQELLKRAVEEAVGSQ